MLYKEVKKEKIYYFIWHSCFICFYVLCFWFRYKWSWVDNFMLIFMLKVSWVISSRYRGIPLYQLLGTKFLKFLNFEYHVRALENLIKLSLRFNFFLLRANACLVNAVDFFYSFWSIQKAELCMLYLSAFFSSIISYVALKKIASLLSNNGHTSIKIKFLMMKLIITVVWKTYWDFLPTT